MITEDYVSPKVAMLLREKGFDVLDTKWYLIHDNGFAELFDKKDEYTKPQDIWIKCPSLSIVMKWLREVYKLNIQPCIVRTLELKKAYNATIYDDNCEQIKSHFGCNIFCGFPTYEEACEEAIKYCLTNLI